MTFELEPWNRGVSNEELLDDMRKVANDLGRTPRYNEYREHSRFSSKLFEVRFGSWNNALRKAGLKVTSRQDVSDEELFENLARVWTALGRQPRRQEIKKPVSDFSKGTYERRFCGWRNALECFIAFANSEATIAPPPQAKSAPNQGPRFPGLRTRWRILQADRFCCRSCGRSPAVEAGVSLHVDHIVPWSKGGRTVGDNLQTLCEQCNLGKGDT